MDLEEFKTHSKNLIDFISDFYKVYDEQNVIPGNALKANFLLDTLSGKKYSVFVLKIRNGFIFR